MTRARVPRSSTMSVPACLCRHSRMFHGPPAQARRSVGSSDLRTKRCDGPGYGSADRRRTEGCCRTRTLEELGGGRGARARRGGGARGREPGAGAARGGASPARGRRAGARARRGGGAGSARGRRAGARARRGVSAGARARRGGGAGSAGVQARRLAGALSFFCRLLASGPFGPVSTVDHARSPRSSGTSACSPFQHRRALWLPAYTAERPTPATRTGGTSPARPTSARSVS